MNKLTDFLLSAAPREELEALAGWVGDGHPHALPSLIGLGRKYPCLKVPTVLYRSLSTREIKNTCDPLPYNSGDVTIYHKKEYSSWSAKRINNEEFGGIWLILNNVPKGIISIKDIYDGIPLDEIEKETILAPTADSNVWGSIMIEEEFIIPPGEYNVILETTIGVLKYDVPRMV